MGEKRGTRELSPDITDFPFYNDRAAKRVSLEDVLPAVKNNPNTISVGHQETTGIINTKGEVPKTKPAPRRKSRKRLILKDQKKKAKKIVEEAPSRSNVAATSSKVRTGKLSTATKLKPTSEELDEDPDILFTNSKKQKLKNDSESMKTERKSIIGATQKLQKSLVIKLHQLKPPGVVTTADVSSNISNPNWAPPRKEYSSRNFEFESNNSKKELKSATDNTEDLQESLGILPDKLIKATAGTNLSIASSKISIRKVTQPNELETTLEELEDGSNFEIKKSKDELESKLESAKEELESECEGSQDKLESESEGTRDKLKSGCEGSKEKLERECQESNDKMETECQESKNELEGECEGSNDKMESYCGGSTDKLESDSEESKDKMERYCGGSKEKLESESEEPKDNMESYCEGSKDRLESETEVSKDKMASECSGSNNRLEIVSDMAKDNFLPTSEGEKAKPAASDEFISSENFKIEITNLPSPLSYQEARRLVQEKLQLNARKLKLAYCFSAPPTIFATFESEEGRVKAVAAVNGVVYREKILHAKPAPARNSSLPFQRKQVDQSQLSSAEVEEQIIKSVAPLQHLPYSEQLKLKHKELRQIVNYITSSIVQMNKDLRPDIVNGELKYKINLNVPLPLSSPVTTGYRNKCELTIGTDFKQSRVVGHRLAGFKEGCVDVGAITGVRTIPEFVRVVAKKFEVFIKHSRFSPYDPASGSGLYRTLTVRMTKLEEVMLYLTISCGVLTEPEAETLVKNIKIHFVKVQGRTITSFFIKNTERAGQKERNEPVLVFGKPTITEKILDLSFEISPDAFFQVNSSCAEILYTQIAQITHLDKNTTLLDICCGTGTIGLACLKLGSVGEVIGIESCAAAVNDAKRNAQINGFEKQCQFYTGRAEDLLEAAINMAKFDNIVAVVDPPRAGLASSVISVLRKCRKIRRLVYVACKLQACKDNLVSFARPVSKKYQGAVFIPEKIIPVDMFPHTNNVECILLLNRYVPEMEGGVASSA